MEAMKPLGLSLGLAATLTLAAGAWTSPDGAPSEDVSFERLKGLVGDWVEIDENGNATGEVVSSFRLTAGGTALVETLFAGTDKEMLTVYHQDGEDLVLTHYCMLGNQPRMKARAGSDGELVFECVGGGNIRTQDEKHMHQGLLVWHDEDHVESKWNMTEKGESVYTAHFHLRRLVD